MLFRKIFGLIGWNEPSEVYLAEIKKLKADLSKAEEKIKFLEEDIETSNKAMMTTMAVCEEYHMGRQFPPLTGGRIMLDGLNGELKRQQDEVKRLTKALSHIRKNFCDPEIKSNGRQGCAGTKCSGWIAARVLSGQSWTDDEFDIDQDTRALNENETFLPPKE